MPKTALFIDDEPEMTRILANTFGSRGYQVFVANSGEEAISILERNHIDAVTLDLNMPGMDGIEVAAVMNKRFPNVKIIVVSGFGGEYDDQLKTVKVDAHVPKPLNIAALLKKIPELIGN
ncbi:MAG: response regulator [Candidatus Omnitrophica bacterium]|nr:response regulator [Candidatus Omnitrophota bacterium]